MSFYRNKFQRRPSVTADLSRLLLFCRFDFRQKAWSLPAFDDPQEAVTIPTIFARRFLLPATASDIRFPDPTAGFQITPAAIFQTKGAGARATDLRRRPRAKNF